MCYATHKPAQNMANSEFKQVEQPQAEFSLDSLQRLQVRAILE